MYIEQLFSIQKRIGLGSSLALRPENPFLRAKRWPSGKPKFYLIGTWRTKYK